MADKSLIPLDSYETSLAKPENFERLCSLVTKAGNDGSLSFHTLNSEAIEKLSSEMKEVDRAARAFGRSNSQTASKLISLTMMESGPYRAMRQCLAQIESKRSALKENLFKFEEGKRKLEDMACAQSKGGSTVKNSMAMAALASDLADAVPYIEGAIKEIAIFKDAYNQIRENNNIPENWDEKDFEEAEISHHIKQAFKLAYRDFVSSRTIGPGALEYLEQFGVHPQAAHHEISRHYQETEEFIRSHPGQVPTIDAWMDFLDRMATVFGEEYKKMVKRIGLSSLLNDNLVYRELKHEKSFDKEAETSI